MQGAGLAQWGHTAGHCSCPECASWCGTWLWPRHAGNEVAASQPCCKPHVGCLTTFACAALFWVLCSSLDKVPRGQQSSECHRN